MPLTAFVDKKVSDELERKFPQTNNDKESVFPEHNFLSMCLKIGLTIEDLKFLTYIDAIKILLSFCDEETTDEDEREATQEEINNLVAMM